MTDKKGIANFRLANQLISAAKLDKVFPQYIPNFKEELIPYIITELEDAQRDPNHHGPEKLKKIASHTCTIESTHTNLTNMINTLEELGDEEDEDAIVGVKRGYYQATARTLAYGFDKIEEDKIERDDTGRVTAITEERLQNTECAKALLENDEQFGGKRKKQRKTKKRLTKKRKTLRRIRH